MLWYDRHLLLENYMRIYWTYQFMTGLYTASFFIWMDIAATCQLRLMESFVERDLIVCALWAGGTVRTTSSTFNIYIKSTNIHIHSRERGIEWVNNCCFWKKWGTNLVHHASQLDGVFDRRIPVDVCEPLSLLYSAKVPITSTKRCWATTTTLLKATKESDNVCGAFQWWPGNNRGAKHEYR